MNPCLTSQAGSAEAKLNSSSRKSTLNITLGDVNLEATKIVSNALLRRKARTNKEEKDIYLAGPYFPWEEYEQEKRMIKKNYMFSPNEKFANNEQCSEVKKSSFMEIVITKDKSNLSERGEPGQMKMTESKVPIVSITDLTDETSSKLPDELQTKMTEDCIQKETNLHESKETKLGTIGPAHSRRPSRNVDLQENPVTREKVYEIAKDKQSASIRADKNAKFFEEKRNVSSSPNFRRSSSRLEYSLGPPTSSFERRRESRLPHVGNESKPSSNHKKNSRISAGTDPFSLENILNPSLRESLKKILNPQSYVASENIEDNTTPMVTRDNGIIFDVEGTVEDEILSPTIRRRLTRHYLMEFDEQGKSTRSDSLRYRNKSKKLVGLGGQSSELSSTKCTGIVVASNRPVRMLSAGSQFAVKGVIGQWLKGDSTNTARSERGKGRAEKQETYREVQLLKVGLSMRMLAGIV